MDSDGFIPVKYSKRSKGRRNCDREIVSLAEPAEGDVAEVEINYCKDVAIRKISAALGEIQESDYFKCFMKALEELVDMELDKALGDIAHIVCYGLGSLCTTTKSIEQFALLVNVQKKLRIPMEFYDPIFTPVDKSIISEVFHHKVIQVNEEGKRTADELTLFFLPHCPHMLSNNVLFSNWSPTHLQNCIIVSNGFSKVLSNSRNPRKPPYDYLLRAKPFTKELVLVNSFIPMDVFNDISLHVFPSALLKTIAIEVWAVDDQDQGRPRYHSAGSISIDDEMIRS